MNKIKIENITKEILLIIYIVLGILRTSTIDIIHFDSICKYLQIVSLGIIFIISGIDLLKKKIKINFFIIILGIYSIINLIITKHTFFLGFLAFYLAFINLDYKKTVFKLNISIIITSLLIIILAITGIILNDTTTRDTEDLRYLLGFKTSTLPCSILLFTLINFIIVYQNKLKLPFFISYILFGFLLYIVTDTKTGFLLVILVSIIYILSVNTKLSKYIPKFMNAKTTKIIIYLIPILVFIFEIALVGIYYLGNDLSSQLNKILSTRLSNTRYLIDNYSFSFFGKKLPTTLDDGFYIGSDMCYFNYLLNYGIIALLITYYIEYKILYNGYKKKDYLLIFLLIIIILDGFTEPYLLDYKYHFISFYLASSLSLTKKTINTNTNIYSLY